MQQGKDEHKNLTLLVLIIITVCIQWVAEGPISTSPKCFFAFPKKFNKFSWLISILYENSWMFHLFFIILTFFDKLNKFLNSLRICWWQKDTKAILTGQNVSSSLRYQPFDFLLANLLPIFLTHLLLCQKHISRFSACFIQIL